MPIEARSPRECFEKFREHVAGVVAGVLSPTPPILVRLGPGSVCTWRYVAAVGSVRSAKVAPGFEELAR